MKPDVASVFAPSWALAAAAAAVAVAAGLVRVRGRPNQDGARVQLARMGTESPAARVPAASEASAGSHRSVVVAACVVALSVIVFGPSTAVGMTGAGLVAKVVARRRCAARQRAERDRSLPELIDLFLLAASAGLPVATALPVIAVRSPEPLRPAMARASGRLSRGAPLAEALQGLRDELGSRAVALVDVLAAAARSGSPLVPALHQMAVTARDERTRAAEEAARRLPVSLLFPLAFCVLPAAVLLALVPVVASSLSSLAH